MSEKFYGLLGRTLGHSYSPEIHALLGNPDYRLFEREPEDLAGLVQSEDLGGLNVTIPYKKDVIPFCDSVSDNVREIGAANTLVRRSGNLMAFNTDMTGFLSMVQSAGLNVAGQKCLVLGSGGASLAVKAALKHLGAADIITISRGGPDNYENLDRHADAGILVNTTPVGMFPNCPESPVSLDAFPALQGVLDVVYNPSLTGLLLDAEERGIPGAGGLVMLVAQAIAAHELFFGLRDDDRQPVDAQKAAELTHKLRCDAENIILCGMPGSGKSSVAYALSDMTGRPVIDTDEQIVEMVGKSIPEIFAEDGEEVFRKLETKVIELAGKQSGSILSLGGGAVLYQRNYPLLHQNGRIYRLIRPLELLAMDGRPLSKDLPTLRKMAAEREPYYDSFSDMDVENTGTVEETAEKIFLDFTSF